MICFSFEAPILESTWIWICVGSVQYRLALPYFSCWSQFTDALFSIAAQQFLSSPIKKQFANTRNSKN